MHIEPGIVEGSKALLGFVTATATLGHGGKILVESVRASGLGATTIRSLITSAAVLCFFQVLPHPPVGVSEVHLILGSTLLLLFGVGPASVGLMTGLLLQGVLFEPIDLPQYGMNVTTLLVPLFVMHALTRKLIAPQTRYVELDYRQVLALSAIYQSGIVVWVVFWSFWGYGFSMATTQSVALFGAAYMAVLLIEPLVDLLVLFLAKNAGSQQTLLFERRLLNAS